MDSSGLPSLLVEAARTAAQEDGVAVPAPKEEPVKVKVDENEEEDDGTPDDGASPPENEEVEDEEKAEGENEDQNSVNAVATDTTSSNKRPREEDTKQETKPNGPPAPPPLRRGKWTQEEEAYASRLIVEFKAGLLPLTDGTTLRTFLSKLLNCDPMRISKKFVGSNCIGKQVFRRKSADVSNLTPEQIQKTRRELSELEKRFLDRVSSKGGPSKRGGKAERAEKKIKLSEDMMAAPPAQLIGGLGGLAPNRSAAAAGHALLQGSGGGSGAGADGAAGNTGYLAQLKDAQPGMAAGLNLPGMGTGAPGAKNQSSLDLNTLMLQTGMTTDQITQLAQNKGFSSASLAQMLGRKRSFDRLMSLDFQSMQSIDNLANLIRGGMPSQASIGQMKNWDWNTGVTNQNAQATLGTALGNLSSSMLSLPTTGLGAGASQGLGSQANAAFGNFLGNYNQNSLLQSMQQQSQPQSQLPQQGLNKQLQSLTNGNSGLQSLTNANAPGLQSGPQSQTNANTPGLQSQANSNTPGLQSLTNANTGLQSLTNSNTPGLQSLTNANAPGLQSLTNANTPGLQSLANSNSPGQGQNQRLGDLLQKMGSAPGSEKQSFESLLQSVQNGTNNNSALGNNSTFPGFMGFPGALTGGNLPQQNLMGLNQQQNFMGLNNPFGGNPFGNFPQAGGNSMMAALAAQQQMLNQSNVGANTTMNGAMNGLFPSQQNQLPTGLGGLGGAGLGGLGGGMGALAGMDLSSFNLSDPNTAALMQQLLAQQGGGQLASGSLAGSGGMGSMNQQALTQTGGAPAHASNTVEQPAAAPNDGTAGQSADV